MTPEDRPRFAAIVTGLAELKGRQLSKAALDIFWASMRHWPITEFELAASLLARSCEFMPAPNNFEDLRRAARPTPAEVWGVILEAARHGETPALSPAGERALRSIGGIKAVMMSDTSKTHFLANRFTEYFESMQESDDIREEMPELLTSDVRAALRKLTHEVP